ncbi:hypothetical protein LDENG_00291840 [Lucifuga dentata]|nr:hypothetical protein LDENG_00291840 [Lucifuga dentata]
MKINELHQADLSFFLSPPFIRPSWYRSGTPSPWRPTPGSRRRSSPSTSWRLPETWRDWSTSCMTSATEASPHKRPQALGLLPTWLTSRAQTRSPASESSRSTTAPRIACQVSQCPPQSTGGFLGF